MSLSIERTADELLNWFRDVERVVVAFSGGVDSSVVARAAHLSVGPRCIAATADSPSLARTELDIARRLAEKIGINHHVISTKEVQDPRYQRNDSNRCYFCKSHLFEALTSHYRGAVLVTGVNQDDLGDFRPGLQAALEFAVRHPLAELCITKQIVRELARYWQLPVAEKPASPCLASRIAYGVSVTPNRLQMVESAEQVLRDLGIDEFRVRLHDGELARIEVAGQWIELITQAAVRQQISQKLHAIGFRFVTIDLDGFRSGSLNQLVSITSQIAP